MSHYRNKRVSGLRSHDEELHTIYVVVGDGDRAGHIKTEYFANNKDPSLAKIEWGQDANGRRSRIKGVRIDEDLAARGWLLLDEEYRKEGREHDWKQFLAFQDACRKRKVFMDDETRARTKNDPCPGFPTDMLPKSVQALHAQARGPHHFWQPVRESNDAGAPELAAGVSDSGGAGVSAPDEASGRRRRS